MPAVAEPPSAPQKPAAPIPATPAPKPATPNPAPKPKADAEPKPKSFDPLPEVPDSDNEFFQAAERLGLKKSAESAPETPKTTEATPTPEPDKKAVAKATEAKAEPAKAESDNPKDLRSKLAAAHKELEDHKKRLADYESKTKDAKSPAEVEALTKQLQAIEKERDEARAEAMMLKEGETPEFKAKHAEPYNRTYKEAVTFIKGLDANDGSGTPRKGTAEDLAFLFNLPFSAARKAATDLFGEDAQYVMGHYLDLHKADREYSEAKEQLKANWKQTQEQRTAEQARQREAVNTGYLKAKEGLTKKYPEWFGDDGTDPDVTKALAEGKRLWEQQPKTFQEHVTKAAAVELAMTAHPRLVYQLGKARTEIESLRAKLSEYEGSEPGSTKRKTESIDTSRRPKSAADRDQELRDLLNAAR